MVVLPAFINAHTHLEFSSLTQPLGTPGMPFTDWIRRVISWRTERDCEETSVGSMRAAIRAGADEVCRGGASGIGEIANSALSTEELDAAGLAGVVFLELIGLSPARIEPLLRQAHSFLATPPAGTKTLRTGISPHAPYTVHPDLLGAVVRLSADRRVPVAMHLAESMDELQLLRDGTGPFLELLSELNAWTPNAIRRGSRPLDYLRVLAQAHHALVVHGNYLADDERQFVADHRDRLTVVYCPRTHAYFGHAPYPLRALLDGGARVALGTDSRASNPDLEMLKELRFAAVRHPDVAPEEILRMATIHGAYALGLDQELGSLRVGKQAKFLTVKLPSGGSMQPYDWLSAHP